MVSKWTSAGTWWIRCSEYFGCCINCLWTYVLTMSRMKEFSHSELYWTNTTAAVTVNFICVLDWAKGMPRQLAEHFFVYLWGCFHMRFSIWIDRLSKEDHPHQSWWASSNPLRVWLEQKATGSANLLSGWAETSIFCSQTLKLLVLEPPVMERKSVCRMHCEAKQYQNVGVWIGERFIAGPCKETGSSCLKKPRTPWKLSAKPFYKKGEGGAWLVFTSFLASDPLFLRSGHEVPGNLHQNKCYSLFWQEGARSQGSTFTLQGPALG